MSVTRIRGKVRTPCIRRRVPPWQRSPRARPSSVEGKRSHDVGHLSVHVHPIRFQPRVPERLGRRGGVPIVERVERVDQSLVRPVDMLRPDVLGSGAILVIN